MRPSRRVLAIAASLLVVAIIVSAVAYVSAVRRTPASFRVYFHEYASAAQVQALQRKLSAVPGVESVGYMDARAAESALVREAPELNRSMTLPAMRAALEVRTWLPMRPLATRLVVETIQRDPAFRGIAPIFPMPPGGWTIPGY